MSNPGECTAVIMAAGVGSRMTELTNQCPKALLPVGRYPMIWYPIRTLEKAGFSDIIVVTKQCWQDEIHSSLTESGVQVNARLEMVGIPDTEDWGTADSIRHIADRVKTMLLVVSCDFISDFELSKLISVHRKYESSLSVMLSQLPSVTVADTMVPGFKPKQKNVANEKISIGFQSCNLDHIVYWKPQVDMEDEAVSFSKHLLDRFPSMRIQSTWTDCHVYVLSKYVVRFLEEKREMTSLADDLIPHLVKKQLSTYTKDEPKEDTEMSGVDPKADTKKELIEYAVESSTKLSNLVKFLSLTSDSFGMSESSPQKNLVRCYACRQTEGLCLRANTIGAYFEACKQIPRLMPKFVDGDVNRIPQSTVLKPKSQVGVDSLLGESVTVGERVSIKKSVVGKHCKIGDKVRITNSVIMDHVEILESSNISNCIVADSASIAEKSDLSNCIIGNNQSISTMSKHSNEVLSKVSQMEVNLE